MILAFDISEVSELLEFANSSPISTAGSRVNAAWTKVRGLSAATVCAIPVSCLPALVLESPATEQIQEDSWTLAQGSLETDGASLLYQHLESGCVGFI